MGRRTPEEEVMGILDRTLLSHIALVEGSGIMKYMAKLRFFALMIRRIIDAIDDKKNLDDKDYYGNKRLDLAGYYISLLFEDLFKTFIRNAQLSIDKVLKKLT